jgi:hypothetical protein
MITVIALMFLLLIDISISNYETKNTIKNNTIVPCYDKYNNVIDNVTCEEVSHSIVHPSDKEQVQYYFDYYLTACCVLYLIIGMAKIFEDD